MAKKRNSVENRTLDIIRDRIGGVCQHVVPGMIINEIDKIFDGILEDAERKFKITFDMYDVDAIVTAQDLIDMVEDRIRDRKAEYPVRIRGTAI